MCVLYALFSCLSSHIPTLAAGENQKENRRRVREIREKRSERRDQRVEESLRVLSNREREPELEEGGVR